MNSTLIRSLILKDWRLHRAAIAVTLGAGTVSLILVQFGNIVGLVGIISFFIALVVLGSVLPAAIITERKKQNLAFVMSLPISVREYTTAKILGTVGLYIVPWLALLIGALSTILGRSDIPDGLIPITLILACMPLIGFCLTTAVALVSESEGWNIAATIFCNVSYSYVWIFIIRNPALRNAMGGPAPAWNSAEVTVLALQAATVLLTLFLTFYLQSRKRDFV